MELRFEISQNDLTRGGEIPYRLCEKISQHLNAQGLIILPSDTCYSLAAVCKFEKMADNLNIILNRDRKWPFSIAGSDYDMVIKFREEKKNGGDVFNHLLQEFTPGPITIITFLKKEYYHLAKIINAKDNTVGFRITSSIVERNVAKFVEYPITTVPIKDENGCQIKEYQKAKDYVLNTISRKKIDVNVAGINAIFPFEEKLSTVVRVKWPVHKIGLLREGYISSNDLKFFLERNHYYNWEVIPDKI